MLKMNTINMNFLILARELRELQKLNKNPGIIEETILQNDRYNIFRDHRKYDIFLQWKRKDINDIRFLKMLQ
jgi:hypothetical protein